MTGSLLHAWSILRSDVLDLPLFSAQGSTEERLVGTPHHIRMSGWVLLLVENKQTADL